MSGGRPSKYEDEYPDQARKLCLLGATDEELADFFEVCVATITNWKREHPEFLASIKSGKIQADAHIADRLYSRAEGAEWEEEQAFKVKVSAHEERVEIVTVKRAAPPDSTAIIFWLKNRRSVNWRDRQEITGADGGPIQYEDIRAPIASLIAPVGVKGEEDGN